MSAVADRLRLRLGRLKAGSLEVAAFRHQSPGRDPLSGEGSRGRGGRYNPPRSFPVLYLALSEATAAMELERLGQRHALGVGALLPRELYSYAVKLDEVVDLRDSATLDLLGLTASDLVSADLASTQTIGAEAHALGFKAIAAPSASGSGDILALLIDNAHPLRLQPTLAATWRSEQELSQALAA